MIERTEVEGHAAVTLRDGELEATFVPGAGMVGVSLRHRGEELLGQRHGLGAYVASARTFGIPLLHPWANRLARDDYEAAGVRVQLPPTGPGLHRDGNGLAIHGLLAGAPEWTVAPLAADAPGATDAPGADAAPGAAPLADAPGAAPLAADATGFSATYGFAARADLLPLFPFPHVLRIDVTLRDGALRIATTVIATGDVPVPLAYGFHPYLTLPGIPRTEWTVELPALRHLALDGRGIPTGDAHAEPADAFLLGERVYDDAYDRVEPGARFALQGGGRRIVVAFEQGFPAAQVYAPGSEQVVCFEPMAAAVDALVSGRDLRLVQPGAADTSVFSIAISPT
jgi:galactose mutarotase-like enzyme